MIDQDRVFSLDLKRALINALYIMKDIKTQNKIHQ